jgi:hypothetical protein
MTLTRYGYREAISGFFEFPTENARRILPSHLEPAELHHGTGVLSITAFDFTESMVGAYGELVLSVVVAPLLKPSERLPKSAVYPFVVATTTEASRLHAIERWHLPHWMEDVGIEFRHEGPAISVAVTDGKAPLLDLQITEHSWKPVSHLYQCFMKDDEGAYLARITMEGRQSEHEEETGRLTLHEHPFHGPLAVSEVSELPFRELWMRSGLQTFEPLVQLQTA